MGYFSNIAIDMSDNDHSYPYPERQLMWRFDDLKDRLEELILKGSAYRSGRLYTEDEIRYVLPEHLMDIRSVEHAIESAKADLLEKCGINVCQEIEEKTGNEDLTEPIYDCEQITLIDWIVTAVRLVV